MSPASEEQSLLRPYPATCSLAEEPPDESPTKSPEVSPVENSVEAYEAVSVDQAFLPRRSNRTSKQPGYFRDYVSYPQTCAKLVYKEKLDILLGLIPEFPDNRESILEVILSLVRRV